ncbi:hypothetical protein E3O25_02405 [Cryobacterium sp. TMT1-3]|uniref:hypothetical protein n=1 Tax=Cryobacterium sp. TMT1-3 TaxID=1259237 RepID=UPI00106D80C0|nr:hypothetical protein [Cryobacterium sp. TMT1-3]TFC31322.1 hypothetical protein E3O25_02405 [Cryobacterium sp. TMT1-3]
MTADSLPTTAHRTDTSARLTPSHRSLWLSIAAALLAWGGSILTLANSAVYDQLTPVFLPQALAQDAANLIVAAPMLAVSAVLALRGSVRAHLIWLGVLAFTVYNYVIYAFSVPFGPLYPLWTAVLGLSLFALIGGVRTLTDATSTARFRSHRATSVAAWVLLIVAGLFALIWLREDLPALLGRTTQQSSTDMNLPTNPVHTLDYIFFLPSAFYVGIGLLRENPFAARATAPFLIFMVLTCVPIVLTPVAQAVSGQSPVWSILAPIGVIAAVVLSSVTWLLITVRQAPAGL